MQNPLSMPTSSIVDMKMSSEEKTSIKLAEPMADMPNRRPLTDSAATLVTIPEENNPQREQLSTKEPPKQLEETLKQETPIVQDSEMYYHYDPYDVPNVQPLFKGEFALYIYFK
jgi:hypothetical protein